MTIYVDLIFFINFAYDFLLLLTTKIVLKRTIKIWRVIISSLFGALSTFCLFLNLNSIGLFSLKFSISIIMILITFGYKDIKYYLSNFGVLYVVSMLLGGFMYMLNLQFSYKNSGLVFFHDGTSINFLVLFIICPIILYIYVIQNKILRNYTNNVREVIITFSNNKKLRLSGYIDTGNKLKDTISSKPIILVEKEILKGYLSIKNPMYVPYQTLNKEGLLKCLKAKNIEINGKRTNKFLIGIAEEKFNLNGCNCILNTEIMEELE